MQVWPWFGDFENICIFYFRNNHRTECFEFSLHIARIIQPMALGIRTLKSMCSSAPDFLHNLDKDISRCWLNSSICNTGIKILTLLIGLWFRLVIPALQTALKIIRLQKSQASKDVLILLTLRNTILSHSNHAFTAPTY